MKSRNVLLVVNEAAHYVELRKLALHPVIKANFRFQFLFDRDGYDSSKLFAAEISDAKAIGCESLVLDKVTERPRTMLGSVFEWASIQVLRSYYCRAFKQHEDVARFLDRLSRFFDEFARFKAKIQEIDELYHSQDIDLIILAEENVLIHTFLYTRPLDEKVTTIIYPFTIPNPKELISAAYASWPEGSLRGRVFGVLGGKWIFRSEGKVHFLMHPARVLQLLILGLIPERPWILNFGSSQFVLVESKKMLDLYLYLGFSKSKLKLTGSANDDVLFRAKKNLANQSNEKPLVVVSLPPNQFPVNGAEYSDYLELLESLVELYRPYLSRYRFVLCKHPRLDLKVENELPSGFEVSKLPVIELLSGAHLYIATVSATIRWAIASGVPVINYDFFRYGYGDYDGVDGVVSVADRAGMARALCDTLDNAKCYSALKTSQCAAAPYWGEIDGNSGQRISEAILNV